MDLFIPTRTQGSDAEALWKSAGPLGWAGLPAPVLPARTDDGAGRTTPSEFFCGSLSRESLDNPGFHPACNVLLKLNQTDRMSIYRRCTIGIHLAELESPFVTRYGHPYLFLQGMA